MEAHHFHMGPLLLVPILAPLALAAIFHFLPRWSAPNQFFSVSVPPGFRDSNPGRLIFRRYRTAIWITAAFAVAIACCGVYYHRPWAFPLSVFIQSIGFIGGFVQAHRAAMAHAVPPRSSTQAHLVREPVEIPGGGLAVAGPFLLLLAVAAFLATQWDAIPERFPIHWGADGQPNGWATRSWKGVYGGMIMGASVLGAVLGIFLLFQRGPRRQPVETADWSARFLRANLRLLIAVMWMLAVVFSMVGLLPLVPRATGWFTGLVVAGSISVIAYFGHPLIRLSTEEGAGSDTTPDRRWYGGQIYWNPEDPALVVPKRSGAGLTFNMANRLAWLAIAGILLPLVVAPLVLR